uniref:28S ribosomal protein S18c, mitochondrial n=1 Tax=Trichuris muris TaxID=70415 RepID=A0A5S6QAQ3_TRIMR
MAWLSVCLARRGLRGLYVPPLESCAKDEPLRELRQNPYERPKSKCVLCRYGITPDYKNARLLSQFLSSFSGRLYQKHVTGLCEKQQRLLKKAIENSRRAGLMPVLAKEPRFLKDPRLFDPMTPQRPNPY